MKNVTKILSAEHQNILKVIDVVLNECEQLDNGKAIDIQFFKNVISFIKNYADGFHHVKEEDILFRYMVEGPGGMHCNPIPVMLHEHDLGRQYVREMENALEYSDFSALLQNAVGYCYLLQDHIDKEDNVLYPMAEQALTDQQKETMEHLYKQVSIKDYNIGDINVLIDELTGYHEGSQLAR